MRTSPLHGEFDQLLLASSEGCGLYLRMRAILLDCVVFNPGTLSHDCDIKHTCEKKIKIVPISLLVKKIKVVPIILLISLLVKKKIIKIVPIIPPPGPRCRSFGDPFGSEHCGHYRRHTSRDGGYSSEILGGH